MNEHPILFSTEMVRAILDGRKTQTRRVIKPQPVTLHKQGVFFDDPETYVAHATTADGYDRHIKCPYGQPGDRLIVRSTWAVLPEWDACKPSDIPPSEVSIWFWLAGTREKPKGAGKSRPGRFIPKLLWHYLPRLEVTGVRAERVKDITWQDIAAEGCPPEHHMDNCNGISHAMFGYLWDSINAKRGHSWDSNPWVWVVKFKRVQS